MKRVIIGILTIVLALLPLAGCGSEVIGVTKTVEAVEVEEASSESTSSEAEPKLIIEPESVEEPEVTIAKEDEKEVESLMYEPPKPKPEAMPLFASAELDLSSSTPEEIVIKILYYDEAGEPLHWEAVGEALLGGMVDIEIWKGTPTEEERRESRQRDEEYYETFVVLGRIDKPGFCMRSSEVAIVIPTSTLNPYDGDELTLRVYMNPQEWEVDFAGQNPHLPNALNYLEAPLQKNW